MVRKLPSNARSWERSLTQQTGLHWKIGSVEHRSPGFIRLHNVKILDETNHNALFQARQIDIQRITDTPREKTFPGILTAAKPENTGLTQWIENSFPSLRTSNRFWQITVPRAVVDFKEYSGEDSALLVQNMLRKVFARLDSLAEVPVQLVLEQIAVRSEYSLKRGEEQIDIFHSVQGNIYRTPTEIRSDWSFQIRGISDLDWEHRERLSFSLSLTDTFEVSFQSGRQPIPCDLAAVFCSQFQHFSGGTFQGRFSYSTRGGRADSRMFRLEQAIFRNMPLAPLARHCTTFAVEGTVTELRFAQAVVGAEDFYVEGSLYVENGRVEQALFYRCIDRFQLEVRPSEILDSPPPMIPFTACAVYFRLQPGEIDFWADQRWGSAFMVYQLNEHTNVFTIYFPPHRRSVRFPELLSIFAPDNAPVVPVTPAMQSLMPLIPFQ